MRRVPLFRRAPPSREPLEHDELHRGAAVGAQRSRRDAVGMRHRARLGTVVAGTVGRHASTLDEAPAMCVGRTGLEPVTDGL